ncbi:hypothetical protein NHQ30_011666 [Ciborinia camelliae]|nr:hypothetical protein NHQ30_011666 [Ciborinia camelliae]
MTDTDADADAQISINAQRRLDEIFVRIETIQKKYDQFRTQIKQKFKDKVTAFEQDLISLEEETKALQSLWATPESDRTSQFYIEFKVELSAVEDMSCFLLDASVHGAESEGEVEVEVEAEAEAEPILNEMRVFSGCLREGVSCVMEEMGGKGDRRIRG